MEVFLGTIQPFAFNFVPIGWYACNGQTLAISSNQALFALLGTTYGGNGTTTFQLPNLQGLHAISQGTSTSGTTYVMGETGGSNAVSVLLSNLPAHNHPTFANPASPGITINGSSSTGAANTAVGNYIAGKTAGTTGLNTGDLFATAAGTLGALNAATVTASAASMTGAAGGSQPLSIQNPYLVLNFCIAYQGIFPTRS